MTSLWALSHRRVGEFLSKSFPLLASSISCLYFSQGSLIWKEPGSGDGVGRLVVMVEECCVLDPEICSQGEVELRVGK